MEVTNRFKGLDLIDKVPEKPFLTEVHDVVQDAVAKIMLKIKNIYISRQSGCVERLYKELREEEKQKEWRKGKRLD